MSIIIISQKFYFMSIKTLSYKPTFLQKLLGQNYKWWYAVIFHFRRVTVFKFTMLTLTLSEILNILIVVLVWKINNLTSSKTNLNEILTYLAIGYLFSLISRNYVFNWLPDMIATGKITSWMMYPQKIFLLIFARATGQLLIANLVGLIAIPFILLLTWGNLLFPVSLFNFLIFVLFIFISVVIGIYWNIIISCVAFYTFEHQGSTQAGLTIARVASGFYVPFTLLGNLAFLQWNPFAFTFYHPMQIYLGKYNFDQTVLVATGGIFWCFTLYFLAKLVFKMGLKKNESVGM